ncbi:UrcA family protein [Sphingomonas sp. ID0503]|uniref:UrcA family protein n=1 Tax=Sphingomonas sp. ID0503 TaxID=3399691 RepID=UPI003AFAC634
MSDRKHLVGPLLGLIMLGAPVMVAAADGGVVTQARVVKDTRPANPRAAQVLLNRIEAAALEVCGAPAGSLAVVKRDAAKSDCYRDGVANAVRGSRSPLLAAAYEGRADSAVAAVE